MELLGKEPCFPLQHSQRLKEGLFHLHILSASINVQLTAAQSDLRDTVRTRTPCHVNNEQV